MGNNTSARKNKKKDLNKNLLSIGSMNSNGNCFACINGGD